MVGLVLIVIVSGAKVGRGGKRFCRESDAGDNLENDDNSHIFETFCLISGPCPLLLALLKSLGSKHAMLRS